jgi:hypothetical protein
MEALRVSAALSAADNILDDFFLAFNYPSHVKAFCLDRLIKETVLTPMKSPAILALILY